MVVTSKPALPPLEIASPDLTVYRTRRRPNRSRECLQFNEASSSVFCGSFPPFHRRTWMDKLWILIFAAVAGVLNVAMNVVVHSAAHNGSNYLDSLLSWRSLAAMLIGAISLLCLLKVFTYKAGLASGILLLGASSIIGGTLFGIFYQRQYLPKDEMGLFIVITLFYLYRWISPVLWPDR
jgi:hypothetical protein